MGGLAETPLALRPVDDLEQRGARQDGSRVVAQHLEHADVVGEVGPTVPLCATRKWYDSSPPSTMSFQLAFQTRRCDANTLQRRPERGKLLERRVQPASRSSACGSEPGPGRGHTQTKPAASTHGSSASRIASRSRVGKPVGWRTLASAPWVS